LNRANIITPDFKRVGNREEELDELTCKKNLRQAFGEGEDSSEEEVEQADYERRHKLQEILEHNKYYTMIERKASQPPKDGRKIIVLVPNLSLT